MKILIGADIVPTDSNYELFANSDVDALIDKPLRDVLANADYRIFNLEVPLTDRETPIAKCGPNLIAPTNTIAGIKTIGVDFLTLANNHILDQGEQGLMSTIKVLSDANIAFAGIGNGLQEASKPYIIDKGQERIGIYCCAEHEFSIAEESKMGANPFDTLESLDHIANLRKKCDYLICLYHGGKEHYRYPSPLLQKRLRKIVEKGADLVVAQHTHCIGCKEDYMNGTIIYGQGNFLFDHSDSDFWQTSLLLHIDTATKNTDYIPIVKKDASVALAAEKEAQEILRSFNQRNEQMKSASFVRDEFTRFSENMLTSYIMGEALIANTFVFRAFNKLLGGKPRIWLTRRIIKKHRMRLINQYDCEAHHDVILTALKNYDGRNRQ